MLKHIVLHSSAVDNANGYQDAGAELKVGGEAKAGVITAERAQELVDGGRAVSRTEAKSQSANPSAKPAPAKRVRKPVSKAPASPAVSPVSESAGDK